MRFAVVGDATLDVTVAPDLPSRAAGDVPATIRLGPGGQGANVAVRLARSGAAVTLVSAMADDAAGRLLREALLAEHVAVAPVATARSSIVLALLDADGERTMFSDRRGLDPPAVAAALADATWIHCSGYALLDDESGDALAEVLAARTAEQRLSVAGGSLAVEPGRVERFARRLRIARPQLLVLSLDEAAALAGNPPGSRVAAVASRLGGFADVAVATDGSRGSSAAISAQLVEVAAPGLPGPALDSTGSGDAYAAAMIATLARGEWPPGRDELEGAMQRASELGAQVARVVGAQGRVAAERGPTRVQR
ncbi:MAG TPA: PfkB family carbohydrate kinase [Candidatus Limnocylindria bacterium]